jgi:hypothetical protein
MNPELKADMADMGGVSTGSVMWVSGGMVDGGVEPRARDLSVHEREALMQKGWTTFIEVGRALMQIRDRRLYRSQYSIFERYCRDKWQYAHSKAYYLIGAAEVSAHLSTIVDIPLPPHESQMRPLVGLKPAQAAQAWISAVRLANNNAMTAELVKKVAEEFKEKKPLSKRARYKKRIGNWEIEMLFMEMNRLIQSKAEHNMLFEKLTELETAIAKIT